MTHLTRIQCLAGGQVIDEPRKGLLAGAFDEIVGTGIILVQALLCKCDLWATQYDLCGEAVLNDGLKQLLGFGFVPDIDAPSDEIGLV